MLLVFLIVFVTFYVYMCKSNETHILDARNSEHVMPEGVCGVGPEAGEGRRSLKYRAALTMFVLYIGSLFSNL